MTILWASGFEHGSLEMIGDLHKSSGNVSVVSAFPHDQVAHTGTYCLYVNNFQLDGWVSLESNPPTQEVYISFWVNPGQYGYLTNNLIKIGVVGWNGVSWETYLGIEYRSGYWDAYANDVQIGTGSIVVDNVWHHVDLHLKIVGGVGTVETRIDGTTDLSATGGATGSLDNIWIFMKAFGGGQGFFFDDIVIADASSGWLGDIRIEAIIPESDTATTQWTPITGIDNFEMVNNVPAVDSEYVYAESNALRDLYNMTNWDGNHKQPLAVVQWLRAWKDSANLEKIRTVVKSGGTTLVSSDIDLTTAPALYNEILELNPDGNISWTESTINSLILGQDSVI
jgi:hypothetical protein